MSANCLREIHIRGKWLFLFLFLKQRHFITCQSNPIDVVHGWMCTNFLRNIDILVWMWLSFATFAYDCKRWITCYMLYELTDCWKLICVLPLTISLQLNNCIHCIYNYNGRLRWVYKTRNSKVLHGLTHKFIFKIYNIYSTKLINNITIIYNKKKLWILWDIFNVYIFYNNESLVTGLFSMYIYSIQFFLTNYKRGKEWSI